MIILIFYISVILNLINEKFKKYSIIFPMDSHKTFINAYLFIIHHPNYLLLIN